MRFKNSIVSIIVYSLVVLLSVVCTAFVIRLIETLIILEGWLFNIIASAVFIILLVLNLVYGAPELKAYSLGFTSSDRRVPKVVFYFDVVLASSFLTFFVMQFIEEFFILGEAGLVVAAIVFSVLLVFLIMKASASSAGW